MALSSCHSLVSVIMRSDDAYEILGVHKNCSKEEIDRNYKWTMSRVHPDKNNHPLATKAAQKVNVSRDILMNKDNYSPTRLNNEMSDIYENLKVEFIKLFASLKIITILLPFFILMWLVYLLTYLTASDWSLQRTSFHQIEKRTTLWRIKYYILSEETKPPSDSEILEVYFLEMCRSLRQHLLNDPWYGIFFFFPENDPYTDLKMLIIYFVVCWTITNYIMRLISKLKAAIHSFFSQCDEK